MNFEKEIEFLEDKVKFKLTKDEFKSFVIDYKKFKKSFDLFHSLDFKDVLESVVPFEIKSNYLREDSLDEYIKIDTNSYIKNSKNFKNGYFILEEKNID